MVAGLLDVNQVPGLTEFNALSAELNRLVEERVQPVLKTGVTVGFTVTFAGCAEAPETLPSGGPLLTIIPISAEVETHEFCRDHRRADRRRRD